MAINVVVHEIHNDLAAKPQQRPKNIEVHAPASRVDKDQRECAADKPVRLLDVILKLAADRSRSRVRKPGNQTLKVLKGESITLDEQG
jgi:hypothetical protein